jgi:hypothetical protein
MDAIELSKENGDLLWQVWIGNEEACDFYIHVLTREAILSSNYTKQEDADDAWHLVQQAESLENYLKALGWNAARVSLPSITRVEKGEAVMEGRSVLVSYEGAEGTAHRLELIVPRSKKLFKRLHELLDPRAPIRRGTTRAFRRAIKPLVFILTELFLGGFIVLLFYLATLGTATSNPKGRWARMGEVMRLIGPVPPAIILGIVLLGTMFWLVVRLINRPNTRYFEPKPKRASLQL